MGGLLVEVILTGAALEEPVDGLVGTVTENMTYDLRGRTTSNQLQIAATGGSFTFPTLPTYLENLTYNTADQSVTPPTGT